MPGIPLLCQTPNPAKPSCALPCDSGDRPWDHSDSAQLHSHSLQPLPNSRPGIRQSASPCTWLPTEKSDTGPLQQLATRQGKQLFLPVIADDNSLSFHAWQADEPLRDNRYNIPEPPAQALRCPTNDLDIIFMPLVAWDQCGGRLGMGGGFYDRTLAGADGPVLVGLAHECQQVGQVPRDSWDVCLAFIATDTALHPCQGPRN